MKKSKLHFIGNVIVKVLACLITFFVILWIYESLRWSAIREAQSQASIRLLGRFHVTYLRSKGVSTDDYIEHLRALEKEHDFPAIEKYIEEVEKKSENKQEE